MTQHKSLKIIAKSENEHELLLYGAIGEAFFDGEAITAKQVSEALSKLPSSVKKLTVRINSPGGSVFDGIAIYNRLKQWRGQKKVIVDALAASIASVIMLSGDEIILSEGALVMVHKPWGTVTGNSKDIEDFLETLEEVENQMVGIYMRKTGKTKDEIRRLMKDETWFDATSAVEFGLADMAMGETIPIAASLVRGASWLARVPKKILTDAEIKKMELKSLRTKVEGFLKDRA